MIQPLIYITTKQFFNMNELFIKWYKRKQFYDVYVLINNYPKDAQCIISNMYGFHKKLDIFKQLSVVSFLTVNKRITFELKYSDSTPITKKYCELLPWQVQYLKLITI
jgi:hypothetical protein